MDSYSCCTTHSRKSEQISSLADTLKVVATESRLKLLCVLRQGEHCVCELEDHVDMSQSLISHHLKDLKQGGFVTADRRGLKIYYSLTPAGQTVADTLLSITTLEVNIP